MEDVCKCETKHTEDKLFKGLPDKDYDYLMSLQIPLENFCECLHHEFC